jgi:hypothetical protein
MGRPAPKLSKEVAGKMMALLIGGFGFVAALAWNDAVQSLFATFFDPKDAGVFAKFLYAALVTLAITLITLKLSRYLTADDEKTS